MKGILVKTTGEIREVELKKPLYYSLRKTIGGTAKRTYAPSKLEDPFCMLVDSETCCKTLPANPIGNYLYLPIGDNRKLVEGDVIIMKDVMTSHGLDIGGLDDHDIEELALLLDDVMQELEKKEAG